MEHLEESNRETILSDEKEKRFQNEVGPNKSFIRDHLRFSPQDFECYLGPTENMKFLSSASRYLQR